MSRRIGLMFGLMVAVVALALTWKPYWTPGGLLGPGLEFKLRGEQESVNSEGDELAKPVLADELGILLLASGPGLFAELARTHEERRRRYLAGMALFSVLYVLALSRKMGIAWLLGFSFRLGPVVLAYLGAVSLALFWRRRDSAYV